MSKLPRYIDIAFCLIVLPVMVMIFPTERWFHSFQWYVITVVIWLYLLYFINRRFTVPLLFGHSWKLWAGIGLIAASLGITYCFSMVTLYNPEPNIHDAGIVRFFPSVLQYRQAVWSLFMIVEAFSFAIGLLTEANRQKARRREVEAERDRAEIDLYKAQIKPHFLFNTLNSLYGLFLLRDGKALETLEKYIGMLRYLHTTSSRDFAPLSEEADYISRYIELQSLRLNEKTHLNVFIDIDNPDLQVPPMLLVTFVENCFEHGISPEEESFISVILSETKGELLFVTNNKIFPTKRSGEHLGIDNCRKRLDLLYPGKYNLEISKRDSFFTVKLNIKLK